MLRGLIFLLIAVGVAAVLITLFRRGGRRDEPPAVTVKEVPPAALPAPSTANMEKALSRGDVFRKLYELAFGVPLAPAQPPGHAEVVAATIAALVTAATEPRYAPRRPMLLPQILKAVSDNDTSRRELANMIARDPALVGSLLKLANSPFYRVNAQPVESVDRAVAVMGTDGIRSLIAAALVQPVFRTGKSETRFPEIAWEHTYRSAAAGEVHAAIVEDSDPFAAQLLALVTGLAAIVVYRVALDQYSTRTDLTPDPTVIGALLNEHTGTVARRIAASWELSERILEALDDQLPGKGPNPATSLGRSLRFGLTVGALTVLDANKVIDEETGVASLAAAGGSGPRFERMWARFTGRPPKDEKPVRRG
jgi:HD-like signal output (HDOD) protein